jgi:hypothetical protein
MPKKKPYYRQIFCPRNTLNLLYIDNVKQLHDRRVYHHSIITSFNVRFLKYMCVFCIKYYFV